MEMQSLNGKWLYKYAEENEKNLIWVIVVPIVAIFLIGWLFKFADLQIEAPLSDYGTWFWKKEA